MHLVRHGFYYLKSFLLQYMAQRNATSSSHYHTCLHAGVLPC